MSKAVIIKDLTKKFGAFTAVDAISMEVDKGEIFGFLGANGAGKTTAIRMLTGLLEPTSGYASVGGLDIKKHAEQIKQNIGYMSQKFSLYNDLTVKENIYFFGGIYGLRKKELKVKSDRLIEELGLGDVVNTLTVALPLGWKQKLAFSVASLHDPSIIFLDEPTSGVDPLTRRQFWEMIYETADKGVTVFVTTHYMDEAEYCDRLSIMVDGKVAALGNPDDLKKEFNVATMDDLFLNLIR